MPIYEYWCSDCGTITEIYQGVSGLAPSCCGKPTTKKPSALAMVKNKGAGGYPSRQKFLKGTAPYTAGYRINPAGLDVKKE